jgi:PAS domain S-box-containing protein
MPPESARAVESEQQARLLLDSVRDHAIFLLDAGGHVMSWNRGAEEIKGYTADEIVGQHFSVFYPPEERARHRPERLLETATRDGRVEDMGWRVRKNGSRFWANVVLSCLRDGAGVVSGFAKVTRDLTMRLALDEERVRANRAEKGIRDRDEFLLVAAHELRTPLTALQLKVQGLERLVAERSAELPRPEVASVRIHDALRQIRRLTDLVERLLDFSRINAGQIDIARQPAALDTLVHEAIQDVRRGSAGSTVEIRVSGEGRFDGLWDGVRIREVIVQLLHNALKYGGGGPVDVALEDRPTEVTLRVSDGGIGIESADHERIFDAYERAVPIQHFPGLGLGLYVSRRIVEAHGGTLGVASQLGQGATFLVTLPRDGVT